MGGVCGGSSAKCSACQSVVFSFATIVRSPLTLREVPRAAHMTCGRGAGTHADVGTHGGRFERTHGDVFDANTPLPLPNTHTDTAQHNTTTQHRTRHTEAEIEGETGEEREERILTCIKRFIDSKPQDLTHSTHWPDSSNHLRYMKNATRNRSQDHGKIFEYIYICICTHTYTYTNTPTQIYT